ncbi:ATP-dependent Clp protease ATP-binding subunit ClpB, partial [Pancytospora epiphaga]
MKFTNRAQKALEEAASLTATMKNSTIEPEHLLRTITREKSILDKVLLGEEMKKFIGNLDKAISGFGKVENVSQAPTMSYSLSKVISNAREKTQNYISVPLILYFIFENKSMAKYTQKVEAIMKELSEYLANNEMTGLNSDDPEDKMTQFAVEMVEQARKNKYDPVIGRDDEIRQVIEILAKKTKSNAIMVGKPGVGKTAIVTGIAQLVAKGESPVLEGYKIYNVDVGSMVAGSSLRGEFEERLKGLVKEAENNPKVILFMDEIHIILGAGKGEGSMDAANILKPGLADGSLRVIGATTYDEYRKYVTKDPAFERRFTRVNVKEPSISDTITIMRGLRERLEMHHGVKISDRALVYASQMGKRYIPNRRLPDIAIDLIDTACASAIITLNSEPKDISDLKRKAWSLELE